MRLFSALALAFTGHSLAASIAAEDSFRAEGFNTAFPSQPLFSDGKSAYLGDYKLLNNPDSAPVILQRDDSVVSQWTAAPGATEGVRPSWTGVRIAVPSADSAEHDVVFVDPSSDLSKLVDDFALYNPWILVQNPESLQLEDWWFAVPQGTDGVWKLLWWPNGDNTDGKVRIQLRKTTQ